MPQLRTAFATVVAAIAAIAALSSAAFADEAIGFRAPAGSERPAPAAPLRLAESLSAQPLARLAPAATAAPEKLAAMAEWNRDPRRPTRVGFARDLAEPLRLAFDGAEFAAGAGRRLGGGFVARDARGDWAWGTSLEVAGASALRLELADVNLPEGTRLWVYGTGEASRFFDLRRLRPDGTLLSPVIEGDRIHLEVVLPAGAAADGQGFVVRRAQEIARSRGIPSSEGTLATFATEADACLHNGECYGAGDFPGIAAARNGVLQFFFESGGSTYVCSGGLLDDNDATTLQPWILTAHHCVGTQAEALSIDTAFFYRYADCGGSNPTYTLGPQGADLVVTSATTDVTLMRAVDPGEVPGGAQYLPWTSIRPGDGTALHRLSHPVRDSDDSVLPQQYSRHQLDETPSFVCDGVTVPNFLHTLNVAGTGISGGSSGSPIFRSDGYVVGQLLGSCGDSPDGCGTDENVLDGAFSASYAILRPYLSPDGPICVPDLDTACLLDGRFRVEVLWQTASASGQAKVMYFGAERAESDESAFFWFFNGSNFEMGVKMVDACVPPFNRYWVFVSGLTSQGYTVAVTKLSTNETRFYTNGVNEIPTTDADTNAFTCP